MPLSRGSPPCVFERSTFRIAGGALLAPTSGSCNGPAANEVFGEFGMLEVRDEAAMMAPAAAQEQWTSETAAAIYRLPFNDLLFRAQVVHQQNFDPNRVQLSRLLNIKTGGCPEDC